MRYIPPVGVVLSLLAACSPTQDLRGVDQAVASFHGQIDAGQFDAIYDNSAPEMKKAASKADMVQLLSAVHRKLGAYKSGGQQNWTDNSTTGGHFVEVIYASVYDGGPAQETFTYKIEGNQPILVGYHVNSMALITK